MGCCSSEPRRNEYMQLIQKMRQCIEKNSTRGLKSLIQIVKDCKLPNDEASLIDQPIVTIKNLSLNALGYALYLGKSEIFRQIIDKMGANVLAMHSLMERQNFNPLNHICEKGYTDILEIYLPFFLESVEDTVTFEVQSMTMTIDFLQNNVVETPKDSTYVAIHLACENGNINVIGFVHDFFKTRLYCPPQLDTDYIDESTGENCALIACKNGNFAMVKYLYEICNADFRILNKRNENAIQVAAAGSKRKPLAPFLETISYLVETIGIDVTFCHEESLLVLENLTIVKYIEKQLAKRGINTTKFQVERKFRICRAPHFKTIDEMKLERKAANIEFNLRRCIEEDATDTRSAPSSILSSESMIMTPFMSTIDNPKD